MIGKGEFEMENQATAKDKVRMNLGRMITLASGDLLAGSPRDMVEMMRTGSFHAGAADSLDAFINGVVKGAHQYPGVLLDVPPSDDTDARCSKLIDELLRNGLAKEGDHTEADA